MIQNTNAMAAKATIFAPRHRMWNLWMLAALIASFPLSFVLPQWTAWENGLWEDIQTFTLITGFFAAVCAARVLDNQSAKALFIISALFWLAFFGREVSWGAAFMPTNIMTEWGPSWRSKNLWYRPAVTYVVGAMALFALYQFVRHKVWSQCLMRLLRDRAIPVGALALFVVCMVMSTNSEGHGFLHFQDWYGHQVMVLEELVECLGYLALLLAQAQVIYYFRSQDAA